MRGRRLGARLQTPDNGIRGQALGMTKIKNGNLYTDTIYQTQQIGRVLILILLSSKTAIHPATKASFISAMWVRSKASCDCGRLSDVLKRITDGLEYFQRASRVPKSVSADTIIRSFCLAYSKIMVSAEERMLMSLTCTASKPAFFRPFAIMGERALSTINFMQLRQVSGALSQPPQHRVMLL